MLIRGPPATSQTAKGEHFRMLPTPSCADVVELAYTAVFKTAVLTRELWVRTPSSALTPYHNGTKNVVDKQRAVAVFYFHDDSDTDRKLQQVWRTYAALWQAPQWPV